MNTLEFHILRRLAMEREVLATDLPNCSSTLNMLLRQDLVERRDSHRGEYFQLTVRGRHEAHLDPGTGQLGMTA